MTEAPARYRIEPVRADHARAAFDCGHPFLNEYLRQFARQNHTQGLARAYVMVPDAGNPVVGYYTLSAAQVVFDHLPPSLRRRLPKYPLPAARIGELAVDLSCQKQGLGEQLLLDAFTTVANASTQVAVWAIVVDPIDQQAAFFYRRYGIEPLRDSDTLLVTMKDVMAWLR